MTKYNAKELYEYAKDFCESYEQARVQIAEYLNENLTVSDLIEGNFFTDTMEYTEKIYDDIANKMSSLEALIVSVFINDLPTELANEIILYCAMDMMTEMDKRLNK